MPIRCNTTELLLNKNILDSAEQVYCNIIRHLKNRSVFFMCLFSLFFATCYALNNHSRFVLAAYYGHFMLIIHYN
jgi:hypothetical protein